MTAEQVFDKWCDISQPMDLYVVKILTINAMKEYARLMCDKQKEICARNALVKQEYKNNNGEVITNSMQIYNVDKYDSYYFDVEIYCDNQSILNAPYPDELQRDN